MKILVLIILILPSLAFSQWKVKYSQSLRRNVPGLGTYANKNFPSRSACQNHVNRSVRRAERKQYTCVNLGGGSNKVRSRSGGGKYQGFQKLTEFLGGHLVNGLFGNKGNSKSNSGVKKPNPQEKIKRDIEGLNKFSRLEEKFRPKKLPSLNLNNAKKPENLCEKLSAGAGAGVCYSTRDFIGCCPKGYYLIAAPQGMAHKQQVCGVAGSPECFCFKESTNCMKSKSGQCYSCMTE